MKFGLSHMGGEVWNVELHNNHICLANLFDIKKKGL